MVTFYRPSGRHPFKNILGVEDVLSHNNCKVPLILVSRTTAEGFDVTFHITF